jgi:hypothetical protein
VRDKKMEKGFLMDWAQVLTIVASNMVMIFSMFGITISLYLHTDKKIDSIQQEMKDFHGRMERQDAEFKSHMLSKRENK